MQEFHDSYIRKKYTIDTKPLCFDIDGLFFCFMKFEKSIQMYKKNFYPSVRDRIIYNEYVIALMNNKQMKM